MSTPRFERLINIVLRLRTATRPLTLDELVEEIPGYPDDGESRRRQFERDKQDLRDIGVPIVMARVPYSDEDGYLIRAEDYELPQLELSDDERAALFAAVSAMRLEGGEGRAGLLKLGGLAGDEVPPLATLPNVPHIPELLEASLRRAPVTFAYRGDERHLEPWRVLMRGGSWYVVGHDRDRGERRSFRLDRIEGDVEVGEPGSFERPQQLDPDDLLRREPWRYGDEPPVEALVRVDPPAAFGVVRTLGDDAVAQHHDGGGVTVRFTVTNREAFRSFVLGLLDRAEVVGPPELRAEIVEWLQAMAPGPERPSERAGPGPERPSERAGPGPERPSERETQP